MKTCVVTGAAGFIGSHLSRALLAQGWSVVGVDCFTDYYDPAFKRRNAATLLADPRFTLIERDVCEVDWSAALTHEVEIVYHLAAQPGVRASWGESFRPYADRNITATQVLLEAAQRATGLRRFVFASSSSVYGDADRYPTSEDAPLQPVSPYGVTKMAAERLCFVYHQNFGLPVTALRYFTVYGPGQRPDMAFHRFFKAALAGETIRVYGDGRQTRDFTFIDDVIAANLAAGQSPEAVGRVMNIGGGNRAELGKIIELIGEVIGRPPEVRREASTPGDAAHTGADIARAQRLIGYAPRTSLRDGLAREWAWIQSVYGA
jgi:nucleoside-diphosphate-sugar epimerase